MDIEKRKAEAGKIAKQLERGYSYQTQFDIPNLVEKCKRFVEGYQWGEISGEDDPTKDLPRPTVNFLGMFVDEETSNIASSSLSVKFVADNDTVDTRTFDRFNYYIDKKLGISRIDREAIRKDVSVGTSPYHYFWSDEIRGNRGHFKGEFQVENPSVLNFVVADPNEKDLQKQKWIMFVTREEIKKLRDKFAKDNQALSDLIAGDDPDTNKTDITEQEDDERLCTTIIKYYRVNGEVYSIISTKTVTLSDPLPLSPQSRWRLLEMNKKDSMYSFDEDGKLLSLPDMELQRRFKDVAINDENRQGKIKELKAKDPYLRDDYFRFTLYPVDTLDLYPSYDRVYGLGKVKDLIVLQKLVNFNIAMGALNLQQLGSPKLIVDPQAFEGQTITNEVGQILKNNSNKNIKEVIDILPATPFTAQALQFAPNLLDLARTVSHLTESITGDMISKNLSGYAVAQIQAQAQKQYSMRLDRFLQHKEREGKIKEQFYKGYYDSEEFTFKYSPDERVELMQQSEDKKTLPSKNGKAIFNGELYQDVDFDIVVEAGAGTQYSEVRSMQMLDTLLQQKIITLDTYIELYPDSAMPFKEEFKEIRYVEKNDQLNQALTSLQDQAQTIESLNNEADEREKVIKRKDILLNELMKQVAMFTKPNNAQQPAQQGT
jgi:hypothetical protein